MWNPGRHGIWVGMGSQKALDLMVHGIRLMASVGSGQHARGCSIIAVRDEMPPHAPTARGPHPRRGSRISGSAADREGRLRAQPTGASSRILRRAVTTGGGGRPARQYGAVGVGGEGRGAVGA